MWTGTLAAIFFLTALKMETANGCTYSVTNYQSTRRNVRKAVCNICQQGCENIKQYFTGTINLLQLAEEFCVTLLSALRAN